MSLFSQASKLRGDRAAHIKRAVLSLIDPLNHVQPSVFKRVSADAKQMFDYAAVVNFWFWSIMWLSCTVLNDRLKPQY